MFLFTFMTIYTHVHFIPTGKYLVSLGHLRKQLNIYLQLINELNTVVGVTKECTIKASHNDNFKFCVFDFLAQEMQR